MIIKKPAAGKKLEFHAPGNKRAASASANRTFNASPPAPRPGAAASGAANPPRKRLELIVSGGEFSDRTFAVEACGLRVGRSSSCEIRSSDEALSRNHCMFEWSGEFGLKVTDLDSANGTYVNGNDVGTVTTELKAGDVIEAGPFTIAVAGAPVRTSAAKPAAVPSVPAVAGSPAVASGAVDLGLGAAPGGAGGGAAGALAGASGGAAGKGAARRKPLVSYLLMATAVVFIVLIYLVLVDPFQLIHRPEPPPEAPVRDASDDLVEMVYERIDGDSEKVVRYSMTLENGRQLKVELDDLPEENRHVAKTIELTDAAKKRLAEILADAELAQLGPEYAGPDPEPPALHSRTLRIISPARVQSIRSVNAVEPDALLRVREKLEAFSKNEFGIWASGYSKAQLLELATESAKLGAAKWEERDVEHGNVHAAVCAYREAIFYLDTVNPKPPEFEEYRQLLKEADAELEKRFHDQRFTADRALNMGDWETAQRELKVLLEMVPDREDDRYREASAKLVDVEKRMKK